MTQPLKVHLLGSPYIILPDGTQVKFPVDNPLIMLAYLLMTSPNKYRRDDLAAVFYPDHEDQRARQNLRQVIHRLRKMLQDDESQTPFLLIDSLNIQVNPDCVIESDISVFQKGLEYAKVHRHRRLGICHTCMKSFEDAVRLYEGDFLNGYGMRMDGPLAEWVYTVRTEYKNKALWMLSLLTQYHYLNKQYDICENDITQLYRLEPLDESALRLEMKLLVQKGNRSKALLRYHEFRRKLQQVLNTQPENETILLAQEIREGDKAPNSYLATEIDDLLGVQPEISGDALPDMSTPFCGRERELEIVTDLLDSLNHRLIVLKGVMGSGKTRLVIQAALQNRTAWKDGVYYVVLKRSFTSSTDLKDALVKAMGIQSNNSIDHRKNLFSHIHNKEMLFLLDDIDEFPDESELIQTLLFQHPNIKFLVTSRKHLGIRGEKVVEVGGLEFPTMIELRNISEEQDFEAWKNRYSGLQFFSEIARNAKMDFNVDRSNLEYIISTCEMLLGLPLGLEIAASYARLFNCQEISEAVYGALFTSNEQHTFISQRHSYFHKTFESMWNTLNDTERSLLRLIYPYPDGVVTGDLLARNEATIETLVTLQDKSTLIRMPGSMVKLHPLVRLYVNAA